jgi:heat shock protein HslJ
MIHGGLVLLMAASVLGAGCGGEDVAEQGTPDGGDPTLTATVWQLVELDGEALTLSAEQEAPSIQLLDEGDRLQGFGGCNRMFGTYERSGAELRFGPLAGTMMACEGMMELERAFHQALEATRGYSLEAGSLALTADSRVLARFEVGAE